MSKANCEFVLAKERIWWFGEREGDKPRDAIMINVRASSGRCFQKPPRVSGTKANVHFPSGKGCVCTIYLHFLISHSKQSVASSCLSFLSRQRLEKNSLRFFYIFQGRLHSKKKFFISFTNFFFIFFFQRKKIIFAFKIRNISH